MVSAIERQYQARRGDVWEGEGFRVLTTNQNLFDGIIVRSQLRDHPSGHLVHEFPIYPVVTTEGANKVLTFGIRLSSEESAKLSPKTYVGDIEISSNLIPKSTVVMFEIDLFADVTR
jgi:hypothetical protein